MIDHPKIHEPKRTRIISYFSRPFATAKYVGVNMMHIKTPTATNRFAIHKMPARDTI